MYFYLAMVGFEPTPTSTAAPSNTETTVIPSRPLRSLKKELSWPRLSWFIYIYEINVKLDITTKLFYFWLTGFMFNTIFKALLNVSVLFSVQLRCNVA